MNNPFISMSLGVWAVFLMACGVGQFKWWAWMVWMPLLVFAIITPVAWHRKHRKHQKPVQKNHNE